MLEYGIALRSIKGTEVADGSSDGSNDSVGWDEGDAFPIVTNAYAGLALKLISITRITTSTPLTVTA